MNKSLIVIFSAALISQSCKTEKQEACKKPIIFEIANNKENEEWKIFVSALIETESEGEEKAIGKSNDVGILQITPIYVEEVNRILGKKMYNLSHRKNKKKSLEMFSILQSYYNPSKNIDKAIKLHNPKAGVEYSSKIKKTMCKIKQKDNFKNSVCNNVERAGITSLVTHLKTKKSWITEVKK